MRFNQVYYDVIGVINDFSKNEYLQPQLFQVNITIDELGRDQYHATLSVGPQDDEEAVMYSINISQLYKALKRYIHENDK